MPFTKTFEQNMNSLNRFHFEKLLHLFFLSEFLGVGDFIVYIIYIRNIVQTLMVEGTILTNTTYTWLSVCILLGVALIITYIIYIRASVHILLREGVTLTNIIYTWEIVQISLEVEVIIT